jgi:hypothetical protein
MRKNLGNVKHNFLRTTFKFFIMLFSLENAIDSLAPQAVMKGVKSNTRHVIGGLRREE